MASHPSPLADVLEPPEESAATLLRGRRPPRPPKWKAPVAVSVGLVATGVIVCAEVLQWGMAGPAFALLGALAGFVPGYLAKSPGEV